MTSRADALLAGPRGRRLCAELLARPDGGLGPPWSWQLRGSLPHDPAGELRAGLAITDLTAVTEDWRLSGALLAAVDSARYWQEPCEVDQVLTDGAVAEVLRPVAEVVSAAPGSRNQERDVRRAP